MEQQKGTAKAENQRNGGAAMAENSVFIGKKNVMNYVLAVVTQFNNGAGGVAVKARGKAISKAVDVAEITKNKFLTEVKVGDIKIGTDKMTSDEGTPTNVSTIEIMLQK